MARHPAGAAEADGGDLVFPDVQPRVAFPPARGNAVGFEKQAKHLFEIAYIGGQVSLRNRDDGIAHQLTRRVEGGLSAPLRWDDLYPAGLYESGVLKVARASSAAQSDDRVVFEKEQDPREPSAGDREPQPGLQVLDWFIWRDAEIEDGECGCEWVRSALLCEGGHRVPAARPLESTRLRVRDSVRR